MSTAIRIICLVCLYNSCPKAERETFNDTLLKVYIIKHKTIHSVHIKLCNGVDYVDSHVMKQFNMANYP